MLAVPEKSSGTLQPQVANQVSQQTPFASATTSLRQSRFHWSMALFVVGLAASGAGTAVLFKVPIHLTDICSFASSVQTADALLPVSIS